MVFPGRFSTGCLRCRQRKVKCDEAKPTCQRCHNYGKPCLGYTDQFHFRHSQRKDDDMTSTIVTSRPEQEKKQEESPVITPSDPTPQPNTVAVVRSPKPLYNDLSLSYFIRRFVSPDDGDGFPGHFSFLPGLYDHYQRGLLETATLSVSQLATYNQFGGEELRTLSLKNYVSVIRSLQDIIQSDEQVIDDKVIATILLLCTYKVGKPPILVPCWRTRVIDPEQDISGEGLGDPNEHAPGLFYLLERRGLEQIATRRGAELFLLALLRLQIYCFLHDDGTYSDPGAIATFMGNFDPLFRGLSMMSKTSSLRQRLLKFVNYDASGDHIPSPASSTQSSACHQEEEHSVVQECLEMLDKFYAWDEEAATYWQGAFEGRGVPTGLGQVSSSETHYDAETACIIILLRSARLILLMAMLLYHSQFQSVENSEGGGQNALWAELVRTLDSDVGKTIDDMLACVPYALGDIDLGGMPATMIHDGAAGIIIVHSIRLVANCAYATPAQLQRADIILKRINSAIGIRSAVGWMETAGPRLDGNRRQFLSPSNTLSPASTQHNILESIESCSDHSSIAAPSQGGLFMF